MALLNKLFFPSAAAPSLATSSSSSSAATLASSWSASNNNSATSAKAINSCSSSSGNRRQINIQSLNSGNYLSQFPFDGRQVRVLLYRECDSQGRRLLFDSNALEKVYLSEANHIGGLGGSGKGEKTLRGGNKESSLILGGGTKQQQQQQQYQQQHYKQQQQQQSGKGHSNDFIEICPEYGYKHNRPCSADITSIGEMVFGASAMSFRGTALKVHWLPAPARIFFSQVFLTPLANGQSATPSPYSTISMQSLATPRTSICSEQGSIDGFSMGSLPMPCSISVSRQMSLTPSEPTASVSSCPLDVVPDQQSVRSNGSDSGVVHVHAGSGPRYSSTYSHSTAADSGCYSASGSGSGRGGALSSSSDQWSASYQYSTRSSLGSVLSEQSDALRKLSLDSSSGFGASSPMLGAAYTASDGSLQRRICRNLRTSFEHEHSMHDLIGFVGDHYSTVMPNASNGGGGGGGSEGACLGVANYRRASYCANETRSNPEIGGGSGRRREGRHKRAKLGLAVCISLSESFEEEMELFCSEHVALLESMLSRLRACTERAYINYKDFLRILFDAWQETQLWFSDLFTAPRIKCPVWLSITTSGSKYSKNVAERFIKELCWLLSLADTKDTNFFVSTMLTATLTHHLGWVSTVSAFHSSSARSASSMAAVEQRAKLLQVSQKHPYNALWAQLGDLFGALGMPPKVARTIVYGTDKLPVERLLNVLTYFIRCGEVRRSTKREDFNRDLVATLVAQSKNEKVRKSSTGALHSRARRTDGGGGGVGGGGAHVVDGLVGCGGSTNVDGIRASVSGLMRTQTCKQNLNAMRQGGGGGSGSGGESFEDDSEHSSAEAELDPEWLKNLKRNEIPNVLAFRDSRFVQQELRIGNFLMDTGIEKNSMQRTQSSAAAVVLGSGNGKDNSRIRLTLTTPENIEMNMEYEGASVVEDGVLEAIEIDAITTPIAIAVDKQHGSSAGLTGSKKNFLWHMVPQSVSVKEGLSLAELQQHCNTTTKSGHNNMHRNNSINSNNNNNNSSNNNNNYNSKRSGERSLSDLITLNSMGKGERMTWGIEPIKEVISHEEHMYFDSSQRHIEREHGITAAAPCIPKVESSGDVTAAASNEVVFVLGENEPLVNIKRSTEDLSAETPQPQHQPSSSGGGREEEGGHQSLCALHRRTHGLPEPAKKHFGVKFNFREHPEIVNNYMRSKNLHLMLNYNLLMDKCTKLDAMEDEPVGGSTFGDMLNCEGGTVAGEVDANSNSNGGGGGGGGGVFAGSSKCVICCQSMPNAYQTPSNATELDFEVDQYSSCSGGATKSPLSTVAAVAATPTTTTLRSINSTTSVDTLKSAAIAEATVSSTSTGDAWQTLNAATNTAMMANVTAAEAAAVAAAAVASTTAAAAVASSTPAQLKRMGTYSTNSKRHPSHRGSISSVAAKCAAVNEAMQLLKLPVPGIKEQPQDDDAPGEMKLRTGFIPSLFLNVSDHYIPDMVLQGICSTQRTWETKRLRDDLALSSRSASLLSQPAENIAIVADMEKWDVRLVSSQQAQNFAYGAAGGQSAPVGMSQLVSSMLETVQTMNAAGIPAYECLAFLEAKLQEIYLQSETLAAFLLETDFCSLSAVAKALNLAENDIPLLLSIATIHTPQISKKCGISFR